MFAGRNLQVTVSDVATEKLDIAKSYGADVTIQWKTNFDTFNDLMTEVKNTTEGQECKYDAAIDFVGLPNTFNIAYGCLRIAGTMIPVGLYGGIVDLPLIEPVAKKMNIQGNYVGTLADMKELVELLKDKGVQYPAIQFATLDDINNTLDRLKNGYVNGRAVVKF